jgi:hypothetical protein
MKLRILLTLGLLVSALAPSSAHSAEICSALNVATIADDNLTVTILNMNVVEKTGSYQLNIGYRLLNSTADKKIDEGTFKLFFADGTSEPQYGFFGSFFPGDSRERSYMWEYLKSKKPIAISYNVGFFGNEISSKKLNWAPPGQDCSLISAALKTAAEKVEATTLKTAAEKVEADKIAAERTAAKTVADESSNLALKFLIDQAASAREELILRIKKLTLLYPSEKISLSALSQTVSKFGTVTAVNYKEIEKSIYLTAEQVDLIENRQMSARKTITCIKGKLTKKVTAVKPVCPAGYKVKK